MKRTLFVLASLMIIATMLLTACGGGEVVETEAPVVETEAPVATEAPAGPEPVTITIWHDRYDIESDYYKEIFNDYMAEHPNVTIVFTSCACGTAWANALSAAIPSGQGPDLVVGGAEIPENVEAGNIVALDEYGFTQDWLRSVYEPVPANGMLWAGKIWGLPLSQSGLAIIYNKALASASDFVSNISTANFFPFRK